MTTTLDPRPGATRRPTPGAATRFLDVRANLMPTEVLSARQTEVVRRRVLLALVAVVVLIAIGYAASWFQTHSARGDLSDLQGTIAARQADQQRYAPLARAQDDASKARQQLSQLMGGDLPWFTLVHTLNTKAPSGTTLTSISGTAVATGVGTAAGATAPTAADPLNTTGKTAAGTLSIGGTAHDAKSVAAFADAIAKIKGVTSVLVTDVTVQDKGVTFTITATLTTDADGGRFTPTKSTGGN